MALSQIQILGGRPTDAIGQILGGGSNVLQNVLASAVDSGRRMADNQVRQEDSFINERRDLRLLGERRGNELQRRYEATRAFDESVTRDRRNFAESIFQDRRNFAESIFQDRRDFDRSSLVQDRAFGINMAELGFQGARLAQDREEFGLREREFGLREDSTRAELDESASRRAYLDELSDDLGPPPPDEAPPDTFYGRATQGNLLGGGRPYGGGVLLPGSSPSTAPLPANDGVLPPKETGGLVTGYENSTDAELQIAMETDDFINRYNKVPSSKNTRFLMEELNRRRAAARRPSAKPAARQGIMNTDPGGSLNF